MRSQIIHVPHGFSLGSHGLGFSALNTNNPENHEMSLHFLKLSTELTYSRHLSYLSLGNQSFPASSGHPHGSPKVKILIYMSRNLEGLDKIERYITTDLDSDSTARQNRGGVINKTPINMVAAASSHIIR